jgi:ubiquitin carboxyl-terminal hydrolase 25/28
MICFGIEGKRCKDLLEFLEFHQENDEFWEPPQPDSLAAPPYQDELSIFLDDVIYELLALIDQRPPVEKKSQHTIDPTFSADANLYAALGVLDYSKAPRASEFDLLGPPCYEDLGVVEDMSSALIVNAYKRQVSVNPARAPHYLKCLIMIGESRGRLDGDTIEQAVMIAYSEGRYTEEDVVHAYKYFGLEPHDSSLTDENILGKFYAFLGDTTNETETRKQLWRIGHSRKNERIKSAAEDRVATVEQARVFLGVEENTSDDFIIPMYTAKINDNPTSKDLARRAVELIAADRKSDALKHFLKTGEAGVVAMDVGDAYRLLQIPDRTVDDTAILAAYTICIDEVPTQIETYSQALGIIAKEKNSSLLSSYVSGATTNTDRNLLEWPVGLQNIGNTCYLNSLLQFYFTVRPYREMVLDFESHKTGLDDETLRFKKVGSRKVSRLEVERSQKFLRELRTLFHNMITSPYSSVMPEQELARLTLISSTNEAAIRRRSTISGNRQWGLGDIDPISRVSEEPHATKESGASDIDSEATLVADSSKDEPQTAGADNKENQPPQMDEGMWVNEMTMEIGDDASQANSQPFIGPVGPPNRPPPIPPRPSQIDLQKRILEEVEIGAQQDVTEAINNVLFQSECAIKPRGIALDGEQLDQVKE